MPIQDENKLDIWFNNDADAIDVQQSLLTFLEQFSGTSIYGISGTADGINIAGRAPRPVIEHLIESQEAIGIRVIDHLSKAAA